MMRRGPIVTTVVAMVAGLIMLLLRLLLTGQDALTSRLLQAAAALSAVALTIGIINLFNVHVKKAAEGGPTAWTSGTLAGALGLTFLAAFILGPTGSVVGFEPANWLFRYIQVPIETSLVALLAVSLIYAAARLLRRNPNTFSIVFLSTAVLVLLGGSLLGTGGFGVVSEFVTSIREWIVSVPAAGGARGLLIGVALGAVAAGLRILIGTDRPFGG